MSSVRVLLVVVMLMLAVGTSASAQGVLRIGLNDDPDALDPTISRAYVGRLVFAALCDKLFDVTPDLRIVPQLATASGKPRPTYERVASAMMNAGTSNVIWTAMKPRAAGIR